MQSITDTISHVDPEIVLLTLDGETLETTAEHPFYVVETNEWSSYLSAGKWIDAADLQVGDDVRRADGSTGEVRSMQVVAQSQPMYNLTVDQAHTFFVGAGQWLVHNAGCGSLSSEVKDQLRSEARDLWQTATGRRAVWDNMDVHHIVPLEWAHVFGNLDPNRLTNLAGVSPENHKLITKAWNDWGNSLNGAAPTAEQVLKQAQIIQEQFGNLMTVLN